MWRGQGVLIYSMVSDWAGKDEGDVPQVELVNEFVGDSVYELCTF
jgi:hypothetical protein